MDVTLSGTRKEELLLAPDHLRRVWNLRKTLDQMNSVESIKLLLDWLRRTLSTSEFLDSMAA